MKEQWRKLFIGYPFLSMFGVLLVETGYSDQSIGVVITGMACFMFSVWRMYLIIKKSRDYEENIARYRPVNSKTPLAITFIFISVIIITYGVDTADSVQGVFSKEIISIIIIGSILGGIGVYHICPKSVL